MFNEGDFVSVKGAASQTVTILQVEEIVKRRSGRLEYVCTNEEGDEYLLEESEIELHEDWDFRQQKRKK